MCGYIYRADSDDSIKGKNVFSADGSNIGIVISSLGSILIIEAKFTQQQEDPVEADVSKKGEIKKYEIPLIEIERVIGDSIILKSKKHYIQENYLKTT
jgi:hypothetical protein